jgi:vancomycin aglycone glucosyltransferase
VHHGGAGTTTTAARAGIPQVIVASFFDQPYWAHRVQALGIGVARYDTARLTASQLISALHECLRPEVSQAARQLASKLPTNGARTAAEKLIKELT